MKMQNRRSTFLLTPLALMGLLAISACGKSVESKCREMTGVGSAKIEFGSAEEMVMNGCIKTGNQVPDAFNRDYEAWKTEQDKIKK